MNVLVLNAGSSTLKFQLVRTDPERMANSTDERLAKGQYDRIGGETIYAVSTPDGQPIRGTAPLRDHRAAIEHLLTWLASDQSSVPISSIAEIEAVGHRVTHGGERFWRSVRIDDDVIRGI